ncbi:MAG TPA: dihydrodipicolinate synthase family protein [Thermohalobaculum sp.]|nr:dihydrodipicolinate synthase family protein [Thermohalobaculum sp.]
MSGLIDRNTAGVYIISATPFDEAGEIDYASTDRLIEFYLGHGVHGVTILGMMGEAPKLSADEAAVFARHVLGRIAGRVPVIVGVSGAGLENMARLTGIMMDAGAAGVMVAPPGLATEDRVLEYYGQLCQRLGRQVPVCFQDYPQATGVHVSVATILAMTREMPQVVMLKHEDGSGLGKLSKVREGSGTADTPRLSILVGNGGLYLPMELARGADGAMTGFAYPEMLVGVVERHRAGSTDEAEDMFDAYLPLVRYEQQPGIGLAIRKEVLRRRGVIACARTRAPGPSLSPADADELTRLMTRLEVRLGQATR